MEQWAVYKRRRKKSESVPMGAVQDTNVKPIAERVYSRRKKLNPGLTFSNQDTIIPNGGLPKLQDHSDKDGMGCPELLQVAQSQSIDNRTATSSSSQYLVQSLSNEDSSDVLSHSNQYDFICSKSLDAVQSDSDKDGAVSCSNAQDVIAQDAILSHSRNEGAATLSHSNEDGAITCSLHDVILSEDSTITHSWPQNDVLFHSHNDRATVCFRPHDTIPSNSNEDAAIAQDVILSLSHNDGEGAPICLKPHDTLLSHSSEDGVILSNSNKDVPITCYKPRDAVLPHSDNDGAFPCSKQDVVLTYSTEESTIPKPCDVFESDSKNNIFPKTPDHVESDSKILDHVKSDANFEDCNNNIKLFNSDASANSIVEDTCEGKRSSTESDTVVEPDEFFEQEQKESDNVLEPEELLEQQPRAGKRKSAQSASKTENKKARTTQKQKEKGTTETTKTIPKIRKQRPKIWYDPKFERKKKASTKKAPIVKKKNSSKRNVERKYVDIDNINLKTPAVIEKSTRGKRNKRVEHIVRVLDFETQNALAMIKWSGKKRSIRGSVKMGWVNMGWHRFMAIGVWPMSMKRKRTIRKRKLYFNINDNRSTHLVVNNYAPSFSCKEFSPITASEVLGLTEFSPITADEMLSLTSDCEDISGILACGEIPSVYNHPNLFPTATPSTNFPLYNGVNFSFAGNGFSATNGLGDATNGLGSATTCAFNHFNGFDCNVNLDCSQCLACSEDLCFHSNPNIEMQLTVANSQSSLVVKREKLKKKKIRVSVDEYSQREWKLIMNIESPTEEEKEDEERKKYWEAEKKKFAVRKDSFSNHMTELLGDRKFKPWGGSVVDSVIGVVLTQNVTDCLSSSAYIEMAAKYPPKPLESEPEEDVVDETYTAELLIEELPTEDDNIQLQKDSTSLQNNCINEIQEEITNVVNLSQNHKNMGSNCELSTTELCDDFSRILYVSNDINAEQGAEMKHDVNAEQGAEMKHDVNAEQGTEMQHDVNAEQGTEMQHDVNAEQGTEMQHDVNAKPGTGMQHGVHAEQGTGMQHDVNAEQGAEMKPDVNAKQGAKMKPDVNAEQGAVIKPDMNAEQGPKIKPDMNTEQDPKIKPDMNAEQGAEIKQKRNIKRFKKNAQEIKAAKTTTPKKKVDRPQKVKIDWKAKIEQCKTKGPRKRQHLDSVDWEAVRLADQNEIAEVIKKRGQQNIAAGRIKDFLNNLVEENGSTDLEWLRNADPDDVKEYLLGITGLGLKSVECVRLLSLQNVAFPVDTNVGRIAVRLGWVPIENEAEYAAQLHNLELYPEMDKIQQYLWPRLHHLDAKQLYELHYQLITFGKVFCTKKSPNCNACPLKSECKYFASAVASSRLIEPAKQSTGDGNQESNVVPIQSLTNSEFTSMSNDFVHQNRGIARAPNREPIIEIPTSPVQESMDSDIIDIEDFYRSSSTNGNTLNDEEFDGTVNLSTKGLIPREQDSRMELEISRALENAFIPMPRLKYYKRLRTEHVLYEIPDGHFLLEGFDKRVKDDQSPYLLALWAPGDKPNSFEQSKRKCTSNGLELCNDVTCFTCCSVREQQSDIVRGTIMIPCRTAMKAMFPLNGTYFQTNEIFADHLTSYRPIVVNNSVIKSLTPKVGYFGTNVTSIFKGLDRERIILCFWFGFVCVRGFDRDSRKTQTLAKRLHCPPDKMKQADGDED